jgi:hypothetical protein
MDHTLNPAVLLQPARFVYSVGALSERYRLPTHTIRRALDRAVRLGLLPTLPRAGHHWRMVPDTDLPAVEKALRDLGYRVGQADGQERGR